MSRLKLDLMALEKRQAKIRLLSPVDRHINPGGGDDRGRQAPD
jgi:hypothetical protein